MCKPKDMIVAFIGGLIGLLIVEFTLGWVLTDFFKASPIADAAVGLWHVIGYAVGAAIVFGAIFALLAGNMRVTRHWFKGIKLGVLYGVIVMFPWAIMTFFFTIQSSTYIAVTTIYGLIEYAVAGLIAMVLLAKFGTK